MTHSGSITRDVPHPRYKPQRLSRSEPFSKSCTLFADIIVSLQLTSKRLKVNVMLRMRKKPSKVTIKDGIHTLQHYKNEHTTVAWLYSVSLRMDGDSIFHCIYKVLYVCRVEAAKTDTTALHKIDVILADQVFDLGY